VATDRAAPALPRGVARSVLVLGGGSDIALATMRVLVARGTQTVVLAARRPARLERAAAALRDAGAARVELVAFDADDTGGHTALVDEVFARHGEFDLVLHAAAVLGEPALAATDGAAAAAIVRTNFLGAVSVLVPAAQRLRAQGHGVLVVLSSTAAERPRRANFVYGASKAGLDGFAQGLGDALAGSGVRVLVVRPGFVHTKMTAGRRPAPLSTTPEAVAAGIVKGLASSAHTVWVPGSLRALMAVLRHLPRPLFRRIGR